MVMVNPDGSQVLPSGPAFITAAFHLQRLKVKGMCEFTGRLVVKSLGTGPGTPNGLCGLGQTATTLSLSFLICKIRTVNFYPMRSL